MTGPVGPPSGQVDAPRVLEWWAGTRRDLPWRRTRDPWAVLVSEIMLQQTRVDRVVDRWHRFLERFPDPQACASAGAGAVVEEWAGLGYNRRAVSLHGCALRVVEQHGGTFPDDLAALLALPGVGPYTARAVLAFAFEHDVAVVDTNVGRILARAAGRSLTAREAQQSADALVPRGRGWEWNQAMLDLGAMVCAKRAPACGACPAAERCVWRGAGCPSPDPAVGSHAVGRGQSRFDGSFRQGRARLLDAVRAGRPVPPTQWLASCGWAGDRGSSIWGEADAERAGASLVRDGLAAVTEGGDLVLPS